MGAFLNWKSKGMGGTYNWISERMEGVGCGWVVLQETEKSAKEQTN